MLRASTLVHANISGMLPLVLGIAFTLLGQASLRFSSMTGIFPIEASLTMRHAAAFAVLLVLAGVLAKGPAPARGRVLYLAGGAAAVLLASCFALTFWPVGAPWAVTMACEVAKEALIAILLVIWARLVLPHGPLAALQVFGAAGMCQGLLQLATCWLQYEAHLVLIVVTPLIALAFLAASRSIEPPQDDSCDRPSAPASAPARAVFLAVVFLLMLVIGQIILVALELQEAMPSSVFAEMNMGIGNCLGGLLVLAYARSVGNPTSLSLILFAMVGVAAITFYLASFAEGFAAGLFLDISSCMLQVVIALPLVFAFMGVQVERARLARYALGLAVTYLARSVSSVMMIAYMGTNAVAYNVIIAIALAVLLACCFALYLHAQRGEALPQNAAEAAPGNEAVASSAPAAGQQDGPDPAGDDSAHAEPPAKEHRRPFHETIDLLAERHQLTAQERAVFALLAQGLNARSIAETMTLSSNTIRSHMRSLYAKLDVHSQQELIAIVNEHVSRIKQE